MAFVLRAACRWLRCLFLMFMALFAVTMLGGSALFVVQRTGHAEQMAHIWRERMAPVHERMVALRAERVARVQSAQRAAPHTVATPTQRAALDAPIHLTSTHDVARFFEREHALRAQHKARYGA